MNTEQNKWESMWILFEKLTNIPRERHSEVLSSEQLSDELRKELELLLAAHYSKSPVLDDQPFWKTDFDQVFQPPKEIHGYEIKEKLGAGGVGEVYLATKAEEGFIRKVAIKFATIGRFSKYVLNSFNTELEVLLSLNHPNIERLYDGGITQDNIPYLIVEYIDGLNIDEHCEKNNLNLKQRLKLFQKVCSAVDSVHRSLIVHRDIKAGNIMVSGDGEPKLLDFGLAKLNEKDKSTKDSKTTTSGQMMTLAYASPEQINANRITTASDIYSLGILLYYLLTGKLPYEIKADQLIETYKSITEKQVKLASKNTNEKAEIYKIEPKLSKILSGDLEQIIAKAISKKPEHRYLSVAQFSEDIDNYLNKRPVIAKRDSALYRVGKFIQRHKTSVAMSFLGVTSLIVLSINLFIQSRSLKSSLLEITQEQKRVLQVTNFLKNIFKVSDPLLTEKKIVEVKDLLDYSSKQLETQFNDEILTKATLYLTLGNVYLNMSNLSQAEIMFLKAQDIFYKQNDERGTLNVSLAQVRLMQQQGKIQQAQVVITELYENRKQKKDPLMEAEIEVLYGQNLYKTGKMQESEMALKSALEKRIKSYGKDHELVVKVYLLLGNVYWRLGEFEKVKEHYQKAHNINQKMYGIENHKTLKSLSSLGVLAYAQGEYSIALKHLRFVAEARLRKLGKHHILTAEAYNRLGAIYYEKGNYIKAQNTLTIAKEAYLNLQLNKTLKFAKTLNNLGLVERQNKQYKQAQQTFLEALTIEIDVLGDQHNDIASMYNNLGMVAADLGDMNQALELFIKAHNLIIKTSGNQDIGLGYSMTNIGRMYLHGNNIEEAEKWINKALQLRLEKLGEDNLYYAESLSALAEINIQQNQLKKAKHKLEQVMMIRKKSLPPKDWRIAEAKALYSITILKTEEKAKKSFFCNLNIVSKKLGENHYRVHMLRKKQIEFKIQQQQLNQENSKSCNFL